mmetsp:Transcript_65585/g.147361  ORF Transcript_65585/g.147361 Transcript_65585/m.147361 type:complete len:94 (-) Transcript_65585:135-416(-)
MAARMVEPGPSTDATLKVEVSGLSGLLCSLDMLDSSTVKEAKVAVEETIGVPVIQQRLLSSTVELLDHVLLATVDHPGPDCIGATERDAAGAR